MCRLSLAFLAVAALAAASVGAVGVDSGVPVQLGQTVTLTLSGSACIKAQKYEGAFIESFQKATADIWNAANPSATILAGDVFVDPASVTFSCVSSHRRRQLSDSSSITVPLTVTLPSTVKFEAATLNHAAYTSSDFASEFGIHAATIKSSAPQIVTAPTSRQLLADTPTYGGCYGSPAYASGSYPASYGTYGCYPATGYTPRDGTWAQIPVTVVVGIDGNSPLKCSSLASPATVAAFVTGLQLNVAQAWNAIPAVVTGQYTIKTGDVDNGEGVGVAPVVPTTCTAANTITIPVFVELPNTVSSELANTLSGFSSGTNIFQNSVSQLLGTYVQSSAAIGARRRLLAGNTATVTVAGASTKSTSKNNIALGVGLGVGLGVPFLIGCIVAIVLVRKRRDHQSIGPAAGAPQ